MKKNQRLDLRIAPEEKELIEQAARMSGLNVTTFALRTIVRRARAIVEEHRITRLTARQSKEFVKLITANQKPNKALLKAAKEYNAERAATARMAH